MFRKIAPDKWQHFFAGIVLGAALQGAGCWLLPGELVLTSILVFVVVCVISYGFELFSKITGKGVHEVADAVATVIGGVVGMGGVMAVLWLL